MAEDELQLNIRSITERIQRAATKTGGNITLVAATKTVPVEIINRAIDSGITDIGENRVQEFIAKKDALKTATRHFIGTLQRNKVKYLVGEVALIQSVNSKDLAAEIDRISEKRGIVQDVLIEVNAAGEPSKTGAATDEADALIEYSSSLGHIRVRGLMAVPPRDCEDGVYRSLRETYERYKRGAFDTLSVGMSGDFEKAIEYGSNMVRIGTAIFGRRT